MNRRRRQGATLGLVAACLLIIAVIGIGFFFLAKIMGGGRELANASDAGVLNVAKNVLVKVGVQAPPEFSACAEPPGGEITLVTYNRCVAQAILVALNAEKEDTDQARTNARALVEKLKTLGQDLRDVLQQREKVKKYFDELTSANNTRMNGDSAIDLDGYRTAFMKPGQATNIYVNSQSLPIAATAVPAGWLSPGTLVGPNGEKYLAGYVGIAIGGEQIYGVPVFPQQNCHLVATKDFEEGNSPAAYVPPNSFQTQSKSLNTQSGTFGGAVACAIVGARQKSFAASIPGGYIEIANFPGLNVPENWREAVLAADSIFNHQLYYGLDVAQLPNGKYAFSRQAGEMQAWIAYNSSVGPDPNHHLAALYPPIVQSEDFRLGRTLRAGCTNGEYAQLSDALQITNVHPCNDFSYGANPDPICVAAYNCMRKVYNGLGTSAIQTTPDSFSAIEYMKANVCNALQGALEDPGQGCHTVNAPVQTSGLKAFDHNKHYPAPPAHVTFGQEGTILQLIEQATSGPCTSNIYNEIAQRCREIVPNATDTEIHTVLSTPIPMGQNNKPKVLYISKGNNGLTISDAKPPYYTATTPDGPDPSTISCMTVEYIASDLHVNTKANPPENTVGDTGVWDAPFLESPEVRGHDSARWRPSSGAGNLLGRLEFSQLVTGGGEYCVPN